MKEHKAYIIAGSNLEPREKYIRDAINILKQDEFRIVNLSSVYESEPWGFDADTLFLNQVIELNTDHNAETLLDYLLEIEKQAGRLRNNNGEYESRILDLDILFFDKETINTQKLVIPHPKLQERKFVLVPLQEIAPSFIHPLLQKSMTTLLNECTDKGIVSKKLL